ncbi:MAG: TIGR01777 family oxidoreductase [Acidobacteria bacterium]|nr:TIGR01777 family oxidoreductase [Acidobacteriota bacterium]
MKIMISGGTGFVGQGLIPKLLSGGHEVVVLSRSNSSESGRVRIVQWEMRSDGDWTSELADTEAIVNLAGENIASGRWTEKKKRKLLNSRTNTTRALVEALRKSQRRNVHFVSASAVGYYGSRGDEVLDEESGPGEGFLAEMAVQWEGAAMAASDFATVTICRLGVVLGDGGMLGRIEKIFRLYLGGRLGNGRQWMSWIDRNDLADLFVWLLERKEGTAGIYNLVSPNPVTNRRFTDLFARAVGRPAPFVVPRFALELALGEMARELLLVSQRVHPSRVSSEGFQFLHPTLESSLGRIYGA